MADRESPVTQLDHQYEVKQDTPLVSMPDKARGNHRWVVLATFTTTGQNLRANARGEGDVLLDRENLIDISVGCVDCEQPWPSPEPCRAGDEWNRRG